MSRFFPVGPRARLRANLDINNLLNDSSVTAMIQTYGPRWRQPVGGVFTGAGIANARSFQLGGQLDF